MPDHIIGYRDEERFAEFLAPLKEIRWVVHSGSPEHCERPEAAFSYLAQYVAGAAIGDSRILSDERGEVTIRIKDYRRGGVADTVTMSGVELVRRFLLHILPPYFSRVRFNGFLGNRFRAENLEQARRQLARPEGLGQDEQDNKGGESEQESQPPEPPEFDRTCPRCGMEALVFIAELPPSEDSWRWRSQAPAAPAPQAPKPTAPRFHYAARDLFDHPVRPP